MATLSWSLLTVLCACSQPMRQPSAAAPTPAVYASAPAAAPPTGTAHGGEGALTIARFRNLRPESGTYVLEGFIIKRSPCPPCPEGALCKPCMGDHVIISDLPDSLDRHPRRLHEQDLVVFIPSRTDLERLEVGQRRRLTVRVKPGRTTVLPIHDVELVELGPAL